MRRGSGRSASHLNRRRQPAPLNRLAQLNRRRRWVLHLWEAFLIQMDDFERLLELQLRRKLDPLVAAPVPVRRGRAGSGPPVRRRDRELSRSGGARTDLGGVLVLPS
jgi:hypothetical protein